MTPSCLFIILKGENRCARRSRRRSRSEGAHSRILPLVSRGGRVEILHRTNILEFHHASRPRVGRQFCMACCVLRLSPAQPAFWTMTFIHASHEPCTPCRSYDLHRGWLPCRSTASAQGILQLCPKGAAIPKNAPVVKRCGLHECACCKTLSIVKLKL